MNNNIYPCLWLNNNAKEVANYYAGVFSNTNIVSENSIVVMLEIQRQSLMLLNGGPRFSINPSISFFITCETIEEINDYWNKLSKNGKILMPLNKYPWSERYGWVEDKFGVNWQLSFGLMKEVHQKFTPALMFTQQQNGKALEAINFYTSIFPNSSINSIARYREGEGDTIDNVKHAQFTINNFGLMAMDSSMAHNFTFCEGTSFVVHCDTQEQIDFYWNSLTKDGEESMCGWLKDKYGVSWQIVPTVLGKLMSNPEKSQAVMQAFLKMKKFDIATLMSL